jgi:hypothetical protein
MRAFDTGSLINVNTVRVCLLTYGSALLLLTAFLKSLSGVRLRQGEGKSDSCASGSGFGSPKSFTFYGAPHIARSVTK